MDLVGQQLTIGGLLHDIGKVVQRSTQQRRPHSIIGHEFLSEFPIDSEILKMVKYHHSKEMKEANLANNDLSFIIYMADNISAGTDRRLAYDDMEKSSYMNWDQMTNQGDIFNSLFKNKYGQGKQFYQARMLDDRDLINYSSEKNIKFQPGSYEAIIHRIKESLSVMDYSDSYIDSLMNLLESTLTYVPSSTNLDELIDISLYDHSKLVAAFAICIYQYLQEQQKDNYKEILFKDSKTFYSQEAFRLLSFDISGIQKFIYTIRDQKAAKMLRSRSFYLEIIAEHLVDSIIEKLNLSRANLIYSGGGHAYLLVSNTKETISLLNQIEQEFNQFLQEEFGHELFVAFGHASFAAEILMDMVDNTAYSDLYRRIGKIISDKKQQRYSADELLNLIQRGKRIGRECPICHTVDNTIDEDVPYCKVCQGLIDFSNHLLYSDFYLVNKTPSNLPLGFKSFLHAISEEEIKSGATDGRIYAKNKFYTGLNQATHLWIGDYSDGQSFNDYQNNSEGVHRLGVLRCDVDDLGQSFIEGFKGKFNTLSRTATYSRSLSLFFKFHINQILNKLESDATIIYAGGDDVFIVGEWMDIIEFAIELRQSFIKYTQHRLTLSTGIGVFTGKTPVPILASVTGELEDAAKHNNDYAKDSIALFSPEFTFQWDRFIDKIWQGKLPLIQSFFKEQYDSQQSGFSMAYRLLELIRQSRKEAKDLSVSRGTVKTISWAQWAYYLSRMEPSDPDKKKLFNNFSREIQGYFVDNEALDELEMAIILYVYSMRGVGA